MVTSLSLQDRPSETVMLVTDVRVADFVALKRQRYPEDKQVRRHKIWPRTFENAEHCTVARVKSRALLAPFTQVWIGVCCVVWQGKRGAVQKREITLHVADHRDLVSVLEI